MADGVVNGEMAHVSVSVRVSGTAPRVRERKLNAGHFAFMRGLVQGLDERVMWARYMEHSEGEYRQTLAKRTIARLRNEFAAAARRERRPAPPLLHASRPALSPCDRRQSVARVSIAACSFRRAGGGGWQCQLGQKKSVATWGDQPLARSWARPNRLHAT